MVCRSRPINRDANDHRGFAPFNPDHLTVVHSGASATDSLNQDGHGMVDRHEPQETDDRQRASALAARDLWIVVALAFLTTITYLRVYHAEFNPVDDMHYVVVNDLVQSGLTATSIPRAFTTFREANWHPLTWLSLMADYQVWRLDPRGYHLTNLWQHVVSTGLLYVALRLLTGDSWRAACVAALFGVHPQDVESVAWVSERKDTLSTMFWVLSMLCYERRHRTGSRWWGAAAVLACGIGLSAKQMLVTLPCVLVLLDYWPLRRARADWRTSWSAARLELARFLAEKWPYWLMVCGACVLTILAQSAGGAVESLERVSFDRRIANALTSYVVYLGLTVYPVPLSVIYPYGFADFGFGGALGSAVLLTAITALAASRAPTNPAPLVGWLWYLGTLVPVIGIVQVGGQAFANRYMYVPHIGLFLAAVWSIPEPVWRRAWCRSAAAAVVVGFAGITWWQTGFWLTGESLMRRCLAVTPINPVVNIGLGTWYDERGRTDEALAVFRRCVEQSPDFENGWSRLTTLLVRGNNVGAAEQVALQWAKSLPNSSRPWVELARFARQRGDLKRATAALDKAESLPDKTSDFYLMRAGVLTESGDTAAARKVLQEAASRMPRQAVVLYELGVAEATQGNPKGAEARFREAVRLEPNTPDIRYGLALLLAQTGRFEESRNELIEILKTTPNHPLSTQLLAAVNQHLGR